jgi:DNA-binding SARP family transcriptional activator
MDAWPWLVKIHTLGRFEILKDDEPLLFAGKVPKKPLELLKALIAFGGGNVPLDKITAALWPETDGDAAYASFKVALHHLRKLLGSDEAILITQGRISLNSRHCRVDATEFQRLADEVLKQGSAADSGDGQQLLLCAEKAITMYNGNFLADDAGLPAGAAMRERLRSRFARIVELAGRMYGERKEWHKTVELYEKGIEIDELREEFYIGLMLCYRALGRPGAAAAVYERCRRMLRDNFNVAPSSGMKALYEEILRGDNVRSNI